MDNQQSGLLQENEQLESRFDTLREDDDTEEIDDTQLLQSVAVKKLTTRQRILSWSLRTKLKAAGLLVLVLASVLGLVLLYENLPVSAVAYRVGDMQTVSQDIGGGGIVFPRQQFDLDRKSVV